VRQLATYWFAVLYEHGLKMFCLVNFFGWRPAACALSSRQRNPTQGEMVWTSLVEQRALGTSVEHLQVGGSSSPVNMLIEAHCRLLVKDTHGAPAGKTILMGLSGLSWRL
jgi:hypothetical protein